MKKILTVLFLFISAAAYCTTYYVDATGGNDANTGTSAAFAWKTLQKVNTSTFASGDVVLLKRGEVFYGSLIVNRSNISFGAYGVGDKPKITGLTSLTSWTSAGGNKWYSPLNVDSTLNLVLLNSVPQELARMPDSDSTNKGYLTYNSLATNPINQIRSVTLSGLTGKKMVIRANDWRLLKVVVTAQSNDTVTYNNWYYLGNGSSSGLETPKNHFGYYYIDEVAYLSKQGEWKYDKSLNRLYIYSTTTPTGIQVSTVDTLMNIGTFQNVTVQDIAFEGGNLYGIYAIQTQNLLINNCSFDKFGAQAFGCYRLYNSTISNNTFNDCLQTAIYVQSVTNPYINVTITENTITNTAQLIGMGSWNQFGDYSAISAAVYSGLVCNYNSITGVGDCGIKWGGSDAEIGYNWIFNYCDLLQDHGAIYNYWDVGGGVYYDNRRIHNNFIFYGIGAPEGSAQNVRRASPIYMDGINGHVLIDSNYANNYARSGVNCNCDSFVTIRNNIFVPGDSSIFLNARVFGIQQVGTNVLRNVLISQNLGYLFGTNQSNFYYTAGAIGPTQIAANLSAIGDIDSNYFSYQNNTVWRVETGSPYSVNLYNHIGFQTLTSGFGANDSLLSIQPKYNTYFVTNWSASPLTVPISGTWNDYKGTPYTNSITLQPYTANFLFYQGRAASNYIITNKKPAQKRN